MNDPNGLVWFDGEYHLFFQFNPHGDVWGHMSWGHAVSTDLIHWQELPLAIPEDPDYMIFSGSIVVDKDNTAGFAGPGQTALVAIYTGAAQAPRSLQNQQLAFSLDRGRTWVKYAGNPVLDIGAASFRDPKVFWHAPSARWIMVVVLSELRRARFYASSDLRHWRHLSDFGPTHDGDGIWECPDLIPLTLPAQDGAAARTVWMFKVDVFENHVAGSSGARVYFGDFDGNAFHAPAHAWQWVDWGMDFYASASWSNLPGADGDPALAAEAIWLGWLDNHVYAKELPTAPWRGQMSLPRMLSLCRTEGPVGMALVQQPVPGLRALRQPLLTQAACVIASGERLIDWPGPGEHRALDIEVELIPPPQGSCGLLLRVGRPEAGLSERTVVGYDAVRGALFLDRSASGFLPAFAPYAGRRHAPWPLPADGVVRLRLLLDSSSIELLSLDGSCWLSERIVPGAGSLGLGLWSEQGEAVLQRLQVYRLDA
ncbi:MAG: glycoside hydrolase family 32 protein [Pseudomonadota bacterium]|nr:glycoside hydrolase family 32 protein [Pseudomonadota bacterium]